MPDKEGMRAMSKGLSKKIGVAKSGAGAVACLAFALSMVASIGLAPTGAYADNVMTCYNIEQACIAHANAMAAQVAMLAGANASPVDPNLTDPTYCMGLYSTAEQSGIWPETTYYTPSTPCAP